MKGDVGPYVATDGPDVWVPRVVPYLEARRIAKQAAQYGERLVYLGRTRADLLGFAVDCLCDEVCERRWRDNDETGEMNEDTGDRTCHVDAWRFELVER